MKKPRHGTYFGRKAEKTFEKIEEDSRKAVELNMKDVSKKETKYNTTWKKVWDK